MLLWAAAPPRVHAFWTEILRDDRPAHWLPCFFTINKAIFSPHRCSRKLLVEYKYQLGLTNPHEHAKPIKRHFRLLWREEAEPLVQQARITSTTTQSEESWNTFKTWMWTCLSNHRQCSPSSLQNRQRQLPKRLIEVDEGNTVRLRTVESIGDAHAIEYLALSHCWGSQGPRVILTAQSAARLFGGVEVGTLCKTFQDAVTVTKRFWDEFAVRYLWIDSLCIIQDSAEDWRHESANMGDIYQNAFCTLAATAAADGSRGFFSHRDARVVSPCAIPVVPKGGDGGEKRSIYYCVDHEDWAKNVSQGPLNGRSWVLQERLLSPRVLHFGADQLYWECSGLEASEAFPAGFADGMGEQFKQLLPFSGLPASVRSPSPSPSPSRGRLWPNRSGSGNLRGPYGIWDQVMETYSAGKLSRRTDRLVALSGIARKLQRRLIPHDMYLAGLWKQDLPFELLWDVREVPSSPPSPPSPRSYPRSSPHKPDASIRVSEVGGEGDHDNPYVAPSWSWASRAATVPCETEPWASASVLVDVNGATVVPVDQSDHMGQVRAGHLRLTGVLARASLSRVHQPGSPTPGLALKLKGDGDRSTIIPSAICRLDDGLSPATQLPGVLYCLPILRGERNRVPRYRGLLLVPSPSQSPAPSGREGQFQFRRYGTFTADSFGDEFLVSSCVPSWPLEAGDLRPENRRCEFTIV
ncbi:uncharacterized protein Z520_08529 [Fonsecaea multimorphosa CBS 102226]|uniref:Heterokaryon incompatibility domain-containing protein n=1 Tax=Fonsecaea multimorphosa CBS 102226 TaxID=1442371 RepID=A0A0D2IFD4_9EURO|nr:uncharacterized protein Z520_08529 [Fonsecaea multimorphosa CBS 102226]KIX95821.1 hypothetical protein Z520_08529 [Fonsecaea multimorphosa CBS 102226]